MYVQLKPARGYLLERLVQRLRQQTLTCWVPLQVGASVMGNILPFCCFLLCSCNIQSVAYYLWIMSLFLPSTAIIMKSNTQSFACHHVCVAFIVVIPDTPFYCENITLRFHAVVSVFIPSLWFLQLKPSDIPFVIPSFYSRTMLSTLGCLGYYLNPAAPSPFMHTRTCKSSVIFCFASGRRGSWGSVKAPFKLGSFWVALTFGPKAWEKRELGRPSRVSFCWFRTSR